MKLKLVFDSWPEGTPFVFQTGSFHAGTTFEVELDLRPEEVLILDEAFAQGHYPKVVLYGKK